MKVGSSSTSGSDGTVYDETSSEDEAPNKPNYDKAYSVMNVMVDAFACYTEIFEGHAHQQADVPSTRSLV
jgi:hypothetical protein